MSNDIGKTIQDEKSFPEGDKFAVLYVYQNGSGYASSFRVVTFESQADFSKWIVENNSSKKFVPVVMKKLDIEIVVDVKNLDDKKDI